MTASAKPLFQATKPKPHPAQRIIEGLPRQSAPTQRDPLDFDPTPPDAPAPFLYAEGARLRQIGGPVWENAVGNGLMAGEIARHGFEVIGSDIVDRGWPGTIVRSFYDFDQPPGGAQIIITNPPYGEITTRGHGRWLRKVFDMRVRYCAMLLGWDWMAGRINGLDALHAEFPVSRVYLCCWKIDFRGQGQAPQRNGWLVWDRDHQGATTLHRLFRDVPDNRQAGFDL